MTESRVARVIFDRREHQSYLSGLCGKPYPVNSNSQWHEDHNVSIMMWQVCWADKWWELIVTDTQIEEVIDFGKLIAKAMDGMK